MFHTISFGAADGDDGALVKAPDGSVELLRAAHAPADFAVPDAALAYLQRTMANRSLVDGGEWDGSGFRSTGTLVSLAWFP